MFWLSHTSLLSCIVCFGCNLLAFPFANGHSLSKCAVSQIALVNIDFLLFWDLSLTQPLTSFWTSSVSSRSVVVCWFVCILGTLWINKTEQNCLYISASQGSLLIQSMASMLFAVGRTFFVREFSEIDTGVCLLHNVWFNKKDFCYLYDSYTCNFMIHTLCILSPRVWHRPAGMLLERRSYIIFI